MSQGAVMSAECYYNCSSKKCSGEDFCVSCGDYCCIPEFESAFLLNLIGKEPKLALVYLNFQKITPEREDGYMSSRCIGEEEQMTTSILYTNFKNQSKIKPRKWPRIRCFSATNEFTKIDSYLEEELESNKSNGFLPVTQSETKPDHTKLLEKVDSLREIFFVCFRTIF